MSKLDLAINALQDKYSTARQQYWANLGMLGGTKMPKIACEAGYKESITSEDLYQMYTRMGLGHGIIQKLMSLVWETPPYMIEGDRDDNTAVKETPTEKEIKMWASRVGLWRSIKLADEARSVNEYSVLIMYVKDGKSLSEPLESIPSLDAIEGFQLAWQHEITVASRYSEEKYRNSMDWQKPRTWSYVEYKPDGVSNGNTYSTDNSTIHHSRVFVFGDEYGIGRNANGNRVLVPCYNNIAALQQIDAAGTAGTIKAASQHMTWSFQESSAIADIAKQYNVKPSELQAKFQEMVDRVNSSIDSAIITSGADISTLDVKMPDLSQARAGHQDQVASSTGIAWTELVGFQTGERASSENSSQTRRTAKARQTDVETFDINNFFMWLQSYGLWKGKILDCQWNDLLESTLEEKLANSLKMAQVNQANAIYGEPVFTKAEMRTTADFEAEPEMSEEERRIIDEGEEIDQSELPPE